MRWKGLIFIIVLIAVIFFLASIFTDNWLEGKIENTASNINGAQVNIDNLDCSLLKLSMKWDRLQIADSKNTMKNIVETGPCDLDLAFIPLLYRSVVVEKFEISDFQSGTRRDSDGKLKKKAARKSKKEQQSQQSVPKQPGLIQKTTQKLYSQLQDYGDMRFQNVKGKLNTDSLMAVVNLQSVAYVDSVEKVYRKRYEYWNQELNSKAIQKELNQLEKDYNKIKAIDPESIKSVKKLKNTVALIKKARKDLNKVRNRVEKYGSDINSDFANIKVASTELQDIVEQDYRKVKKLAKIPDLKRQNIANFIFGEEVVNRVGSYLAIVAKIRDYHDKISAVKKEEQKEEKPERFEGQDIEYSGKYNFPKFWIKEIALSGHNSRMDLKGRIKNLVSDQKKINAATEMDIEGQRTQGGQLQFSALIDKRKPAAQDIFALNVQDIALDNTVISSSEIFPYKIAQGKGQVEAEIKMAKSEFQGGLAFNSYKLNFAKTKEQSGNPKINSIIEKIVRDLDQLTINVDISGSEGQTDFQLTSNLDDVFNKRIRSVVSEEIAAARQELEKRVDAKVSAERQKYEKLIAGKTEDLQQEVKKYEQQIKKYEKQLQDKQKEVQARIKKIGKEKTEDLKKKGQETLDDLF